MNLGKFFMGLFDFAGIAKSYVRREVDEAAAAKLADTDHIEVNKICTMTFAGRKWKVNLVLEPVIDTKAE
jgi:hypothetical protein